MCLMLANLETRAHWRGDARGLDPNGGTAIKVSAGAGQLVALRSFPLRPRSQLHHSHLRRYFSAKMTAWARRLPDAWLNNVQHVGRSQQ